jgi:hypothetical protein
MHLQGSLELANSYIFNSRLNGKAIAVTAVPVYA